MLQVRVGGGTLGLAAQCLVDRRCKLCRQRRLDADQRHAGIAPLEPDLDAVGGVRVDDDAVELRNAAYRREAIGMRAFAGHESRVGERLPIRRAGEIEPSVARNLQPELAHDGRIAADEVEDEALEIRSLRDVHRRTRCRNRLVAGADTIASRFEELVEYVVLVGSEDQAADRQAHRLRDVAGENVAEVAAGHGEVHLLAIARDCEITLEVVHDLSRDPRPVDRVDRAEPVAGLELRVSGDGLD